MSVERCASAGISDSNWPLDRGQADRPLSGRGDTPSLGNAIMPSLLARGFGFFLRQTGSITKSFSGGPGMAAVISAARALPLATPTDKQRSRVEVSCEEFAGRSIWCLRPRDAPPRGHLLYFHGGGYIFSAAPPHWSALCELVERHGIAVTAPLYPLAPESGVEETTGWALDYYRDFIAHHSAPFVLGGDSAGGGLATATAMAARDAGLQMPAGLLLICPWLDVTGSHPDQAAIEPRDSILRIRGIRDAGILYRRTIPADDWRVSPIHGDWAGLPPVMAFGGGDDILVTDSRALQARLPDMIYDERDGLMHVWPLFFFSESKTARKNMADWIVAQNGQIAS